MKRRRGFVANSSSSSFVVAFPCYPRSMDDVKKFMFPRDNLDTIISEYDYSTTVAQVVTQVWQDIKGQRKLTLTQMATELSSGYEEFLIDASPEDRAEYYDIEAQERRETEEYYRKYHDLRAQMGLKPGESMPGIRPEGKEGIAYDAFKEHEKARFDRLHAKWDKQDKIRKRAGKRSAKVFMEKNKGKWFGRFNYSDNDGPFMILMEHGDVFRNLEHIRISHH